MKKYYKYGEMMLILREEYQKCKNVIEELNKCVVVDGNPKNVHFKGLLQENKENNIIRLHVEKEYSTILKKIGYLKYNWYCQYLYMAYFNVVKENEGYNIRYDNSSTLVDGKKYFPKVEILDSKKFSELIDELFSLDLMNMEVGNFRINHDRILLDFGFAHINTYLGYDSSVTWKGYDDIIKYSVNKYYCPALLEDIFSLEIPADKISSDWLKLFEKYECNFDKEILFDVDIDAQSKKGILQVSEIRNKNEKNIVKLLRKTKQ